VLTISFFYLEWPYHLTFKPPVNSTHPNLSTAMSVFQPISVLRLYRMIANQIKAKIESGVYATGERLPSERDLAEMLAVSRPSVREALIALEIEGYVDVRVGSGVFVTQPDAAPGAAPEAALPAGHGEIGAHDLLEARLVLEPACAELAARNATPEQLLAMEAAVLALPASGRPSQHNDSFHLAIAEASGNVALAASVLHLWKLSESSAIFNKLNQHFVGDEVWETAHAEHLILLNAIRKRRPAAARRAMREHLEKIRARLGLDAAGSAEI
jgi:DNA-binding FadR family transcriptional regulator